MLSQLGPLFGYHPNASKMYLVVKDKCAAAATECSFAALLLQLMDRGTWVQQLAQENMLQLNICYFHARSRSGVMR